MPLLLLLLLQQPRDVRPAAHATGTLAGVVVTDDNEGRPIRRARVSLSAGTPGSGQTVITDDQGRFTFANLPPGRYIVNAYRSGWISMQYGAKGPQRAGTAVPVTEGERVSINVRLPRGAVITGFVIDQNGQPAPDMAVRAMRYAIQGGERRLVTVGTSAMTDDRGIYRIYSLPAGEYLVGAMPAAINPPSLNTEVRLTTDLDVQHARGDARQAAPAPPPRTADIGPTYYPGVASPMQASPVSVRPGEERTGVDLMFQLVPTARVDGIVTMPDGSAPTAPVLVSLVTSGVEQPFPGMPYAGYKTTRAQDDGTFVFTNVAPGQYTAVARSGSAPPLSAAADLTVQGERVSGLTLALGPGIAVSGQVRFEGSAGSPPDPRAVRITLQPVQNEGSVTVAPAAGALQPDGRFTLQGATPGRYRLTAAISGTTRGPAWVLRSSLVNGQDTLDAPAVLQPNQNVLDAVITFTDRMARLTGSLEHAAGGAAPEYTIVLFPADRSLWVPQSRRIQATRPAADGTYAFGNLPGGNYLLAAVDDAEPGAWFDPAFLQTLVPAAMPVAIGDGQSVTQRLRLGS